MQSTQRNRVLKSVPRLGKNSVSSALAAGSVIEFLESSTIGRCPMKTVRITLLGCLAAVWIFACGQDTVEPPSPDPNEELSGDHPRSIDIELYKVLGKNPINATKAELARVTHLQLAPGPHYPFIEQHDVDLLAACVNLVELEIEFMNVSNEHLAALAGLTKLESLKLLGNSISDLSPLAGLVNLQYLDLTGNQIEDLSPLAGLVNLWYLNLTGNQIEDLRPVAGLVQLPHLDLTGNQIEDLSPLVGLVQLGRLDLEDNKIVDIQPLLDNVGIGAGDRIGLRSNKLSDISRNQHIPALEARGVIVRQ